MSNGSPPPSRPPNTRWAPGPKRPGRAGRRALVALAVLFPLCFAAWLVWQSGGERAEAGRPAPTLVPPPAGPKSPSPGEDSSPGKDPSGSQQDEQGGRPGGELAGRTVVLDPGHNPNNRDHAAEINRSVNIGTGRKECDTTGTATESGYTEAEFNLDLARRIRADLEKRGATVKMTHDGKRKWGPCVDQRAEAGNRAGADAAVSLHADGAPQGARGFHVILPASLHEGAADTRAIAGPSRSLGRELATAFRESTGERPAEYINGGTGLDTRGDLGGLNLSRVPKVFLECGNMRDKRDADLLTDRAWRDRAARGVAEGIAGFLEGKR